jgi:hypothetical protein
LQRQVDGGEVHSTPAHCYYARKQVRQSIERGRRGFGVGRDFADGQASQAAFCRGGMGGAAARKPQRKRRGAFDGEFDARLTALACSSAPAGYDETVQAPCAGFDLAGQRTSKRWRRNWEWWSWCSMRVAKFSAAAKLSGWVVGTPPYLVPANREISPVEMRADANAGARNGPKKSLGIVSENVRKRHAQTEAM